MLYLLCLISLLFSNITYAATEVRESGTSKGYVNVMDFVGPTVAVSGITGTITSGSGTVGSGPAKGVAYYASAGTSITANTLFNYDGTNVGIGTITTSAARLNVFGDINILGTAAGLTGGNLSNIDVAGTKANIYANVNYFGASQMFVGTIGGSRQLIFTPTTVGFAGGTTLMWGSNAGAWASAGSDIGLSRFAAGIVAVGNSTNGDTTGTLVAGNVGIGTTNVTGGRLIIGTGNVGIGSLTPGQLLDVNGTVRSTAFTTTGAYTQSGTNSNNFTGNVGISSANPGAALDVANNLRVRNADSSTNTVLGLTKLGSSTFAAASLLDIYGSSVTAGKLLYRSVAGNVIVAVQEGSLGGDYGDIFVNGTGGINKMDFSGASGINNSLGYTQSGSSINVFTGNVGISSATPGSALDVAGKTRITSSGHLISTGTAPIVATNDCGTTSQGAVTSKSTDISGSITAGTLAVTSCAITFANAYTVAPNCVAVDDSNILAVKAAASTTKLTFTTTTSMSGDILSWICIGNE